MDYQAVIHEKEATFPVLIYITDPQKLYSVKIKGTAGCIYSNRVHVKKKGFTVHAWFTVPDLRPLSDPVESVFPGLSDWHHSPPTEQPEVLSPPLADTPLCLAHMRDPGPFFQLPCEASIPVPNYCRLSWATKLFPSLPVGS